MIRLLVDENFDDRITIGLHAMHPTLDVVRVQDVGLRGRPDPEILTWAAQTGRIVFTHDKRTMGPLANERVKAGHPMPGVCIVRRSAPLGLIIEDLLIMLESLSDEEWANQVRYVPL